MTSESSRRAPASAAAAPDGWVHGTTPLLLALCLSVTGVLMFKVLPLLVGAAADEFGLAPGALGVLASSDLAGIALASLSAPLWVRRVDWRAAALVALAIVVAGNVASAAIDTVPALYAVRVATGLGEGMASSLALVILSDTRHPDRAFGLAVAAPILVGLGAFHAFPPLVAAWGYDGVVITLAGVALAFAAGMPWLPARGRPAGATREPSADRARATNARGWVWLALAATLVYHVGLGAVWAFVERIGVAAGFERASVASTLGLAVLFGLAGSLSATAIGARFGRLWAIALAALGQCLVLPLLAEPVQPLGYAVAACAFQFLWLLSVPFQLGTIAQADRSGRVFVLALAFQAAGVALGPVLAGALLGADGYSPVRALAAGCLVTSVLLYVPVLRALRAAATAGTQPAFDAARASSC